MFFAHERLRHTFAKPDRPTVNGFAAPRLERPAPVRLKRHNGLPVFIGTEFLQAGVNQKSARYQKQIRETA
jgi:hypothetical protein